MGNSATTPKPPTLESGQTEGDSTISNMDFMSHMKFMQISGGGTVIVLLLLLLLLAFCMWRIRSAGVFPSGQHTTSSVYQPRVHWSQSPDPRLLGHPHQWSPIQLSGLSQRYSAEGSLNPSEGPPLPRRTVQLHNIPSSLHPLRSVDRMEDQLFRSEWKRHLTSLQDRKQSINGAEIMPVPHLARTALSGMDHPMMKKIVASGPYTGAPADYGVTGLRPNGPLCLTYDLPSSSGRSDTDTETETEKQIKPAPIKKRRLSLDSDSENDSSIDGNAQVPVAPPASPTVELKQSRSASRPSLEVSPAEGRRLNVNSTLIASFVKERLSR